MFRRFEEDTNPIVLTPVSVVRRSKPWTAGLPSCLKSFNGVILQKQANHAKWVGLEPRIAAIGTLQIYPFLHGNSMAMRAHLGLRFFAARVFLDHARHDGRGLKTPERQKNVNQDGVPNKHAKCCP